MTGSPEGGSSDSPDDPEHYPDRVLAEIRKAVLALRRQVAEFTRTITQGEEPADHDD